ncbi:hypothetical protein BLGI_4747 [Brevibacillus laterosporus GI-9]|uniref:hypothetical protein n=1 Tax=Brevibacillus laterosporus TaxID=1465 RepID=UPI0002405476|nr:hypothetical protein [Brevibacillus laterosporus]CCF16778.1 hypothetical protein BLGI_4747 [Brevibacillus laterosporus GI-9]
MTLTVIAVALSIIAAILGIINNSFGILDRLSKLYKEKPPTKPDDDDPTAISLPKPKERDSKTSQI